MDNQYFFGFPEGFEEERGGTDLSRDARLLDPSSSCSCYLCPGGTGYLAAYASSLVGEPVRPSDGWSWGLVPLTDRVVSRVFALEAALEHTSLPRVVGVEMAEAGSVCMPTQVTVGRPPAVRGGRSSSGVRKRGLRPTPGEEKTPAKGCHQASGTLGSA
ncbi:unnamed protein product [Rangifer tarandus platyrhynchus]|uniref:Uncharacterized protein n=2 Tax=Rangifer tarandus platyrhynchus TaxID=3082113 RepID=A0ACB0EG43_RANTA|nr:unnamed protein product [Rangifer tarandus platyrhynchus]CAI9699667.1 unnamed protein product [Rangifer tarandus platyrhynchus]